MQFNRTLFIIIIQSIRNSYRIASRNAININLCKLKWKRFCGGCSFNRKQAPTSALLLLCSGPAPATLGFVCNTCVMHCTLAITNADLVAVHFLNCALNLFIFNLADMRSISGKWVWHVRARAGSCSLADVHSPVPPTDTAYSHTRHCLASIDGQFFELHFFNQSNRCRAINFVCVNERLTS